MSWIDPSLVPLVVYVAETAIKLAIIAFILLRRSYTPAMTLTWLMVILLVPVVGVVGYLLVGEVRLGRRRRRRHAEIVASIEELARRSGGSVLAARPAKEHEHVALLAETVAGNPPRGGNALRLMGDTDEVIDALVEDIDGAVDHCHLAFYIYLEDHNGHRVARALMAAAARGVRCRVLVDSVGSARFLDGELVKEMRREGGSVVEALPARLVRMLFARLDLRNHRKIAVIDHAIAYVGSQNIADASFAPKKRYAPWVDAMARIEGPAARDLQILFVEDWFLDADEPIQDVLDERPGEAGEVVAQVLGTGPGSDPEAMMHVTHATIHAAREELVITTPYFVPDEATLLAMRAAARRGVRVQLIVPARNDSPLVSAASRGHYEGLLRAGVEIWEYHAGLLHAKTMTIDRSLGVITSANLDQRSFELNFEVSLVVYDTDVASELRLLQKTYLNDSTRVTLGPWLERSWPRRLIQAAAGILSPLL